MLLDASTTAIVAIAGAAVGVLGLGAGLGTAVRLARLRRAYAALAGEAGQEDVMSAMQRHLAAVTELRGDVGQLDRAVAALRTDLSDAVRHVAVVRYDAFQDMGGRMSFSTALLDDAGDGMVLTSINGRSETRTYAKGIKAGQSEQQLSPEELQVIAVALGDAAVTSR